MSSFIIRDTLGPAVAIANQRLALWRRFKAAWPHNKYLYDERLYYYQNGTILDTPEFRKFLNMIGMKHKDLTDADYDEIESCWFYLKPPAIKDRFFTAQDMFNSMESERVIAGERTVITFKYGGNLKTRIPGDRYQVTETAIENGKTTYVQHPAMKDVNIRNAIMLDPGKYCISRMPRSKKSSRNNYMYVEGVEYDMHESSETTKSAYNAVSAKIPYEKPVVQITCTSKYGWYAIFDYSQFTFEKISTSEPKALSLNEGYGFTWEVEYNAIKDIAPSDPCMLEFENLFNEHNSVQKSNASMPFKTTEEDYRENNTSTDPDVWPSGRLSVPGSDRLKKVDFTDMISECVDSDYEAEEASKWEKFLSVVIVVLAVVVTVISMGSLAGATVPAALAAMSFGFAMGALVLGIGSALLGYFGGPSANSLAKQIGNAAQYVGLTSTVLGVMSFVGKFTQKISAVAQKAAQERSQKALGNLASDTVVASATAMDYTNAIGSIIWEQISFAGDAGVEVAKKLTSWTQHSFTIYKYYDQNFGDMADITKKNEELQDELAELNEENASSKMMVMGQDVYASSLGSFDAIAELNIKMDKQGGSWYTDQDPCASIT